ncbi:Imidazole glycerol phosphate synthase subunit hisH [Blattabacterium sp. (Nauphoeta cinerea)]|uniref:imidazole glycerol phosphate synthase subunit HisH n=1 Tax=Blattabacterium sp. (Nauphoeta cinerea) TaxID=1316444 RepID=UPI0003B07BE7|nr:imidazole glycerol phosphate synthase subunit HisH [Blattabacterium sp. (Nauphoeta cinerea)]AGW86189.1 Imidazole glycerol phosphate synthase subunit hisH [Blattabacterium sp. (Nauphoeta cinerea)]
MKTIIIKYPAGNVQSILFSLERIGVQATVTDSKELIQNAKKIILPGVGEANCAMQYLKEKKLDLLLSKLKQPILGICLGMQLLCKSSEESNTTCIGIFDLLVKKFQPNNKNDKVPQVGWNTIHKLKGSLFENIPDGSYQYFVHSYYVPLGKDTTAKTEYIITYSAALQKNNFYAVQFHPEKSSYVGHKILENFIRL